jgi:hypothetical protein
LAAETSTPQAQRHSILKKYQGFRNYKTSHGANIRFGTAITKTVVLGMEWLLKRIKNMRNI